MHSPARAIAWEFRRPHRWALVALATCLLVTGAGKLLILGKVPIRLDPPDGVAAVGLVPFTAAFFYLLAVFSYGLAGDLAGRPSIYPKRLFALPVTTAALAGWPMLYGTIAMVSLWLATALLARWPWGVALPFVWPALLAAVFLAWTQVLTWMPYGLPGLRVIATVLCLAALDAIVIVAVHFEAPEWLMVAFLAPQLPVAYLAARAAVARARRGDVPDWRGVFTRRGNSPGSQPRRRDFTSPARAQLWLEWRRHGLSLPAMVAILLPFELALLFTVTTGTPAFVFVVLLGVVLTPPFMAGFVAATASRANPYVRDSYGLAPFMATRPLTSAALIAAKLKVTLWSTLAAWLLVFVAVPIGLALSDTLKIVTESARWFIDTVGTPRAIVVALLLFAGLFASTWKRLVQSLYIGLTGREWVVKSSVLLALSFLVVIGPLVQWIIDNGSVQAALWDAVPAILMTLLGAKMSAAVWIAVRLHASRLLSDRALVVGAACWLAAVLALYLVLVWLADTPLVPRYLLALVAILAVPLARLSAAPLALAWNRHR